MYCSNPMQDNLIEAFNIIIDAAVNAKMITFVNGFEHHLEKTTVVPTLPISKPNSSEYLGLSEF